MNIKELRARVSGEKKTLDDGEFVQLIKDSKSSHLFKKMSKLDVEKDIIPKNHKVENTQFRPNKPIKDNDGNDKTVNVNRISLALQKLIVSQSVAVMFSNSPKLVYSGENESEIFFYKSLDRVLTKVRSNSINKKMARELFQCKEVAEIWYLQPSEHKKYGYKSRYKYRSKICSPYLGDGLHPVFDAFGDMIAFGRSYTESRTGAVNVSYLEIFTDTEIATYWNGGLNGKWALKGKPSQNLIKKIPVIYSEQESTEWEDVQGLIERLEVLLSNFADTNDYHASPKIFIEGTIKGFSQKGEAGAILEAERGAKASYLSWDNAPEAVKFEVQTLLSNIAKLSQTPDFSLENVKGLSAVSGVALKLLFMDAHLKAKNKEEIFDPHLSRRASIVSSFMLIDNESAFKGFDESSFETYNEFKPFIIEDLRDLVETLSVATGNKQFISVKTAIQRLDWVADIEEEESLIEKENALDVFNEVN